MPSREDDPRGAGIYAASDIPRSRHWVAGTVIAIVSGAVLVIVAAATSSFGYGFAVGIPMAVGLIFGYHVELGRALMISLLLVVLVGLVGFAFTTNIAGLLCGVIAGVVFCAPIVFGGVAGTILRSELKRRRVARPYSTTLMIVFLPLGTMFAENSRSRIWPEETVETTWVVEASATDAWEALVFYEEVEHEPPLLTRLGLPRPLRTEGDVRGVGDVKVCTYDSGHLTKRILEYRPERLLAFEVVEQEGIEDRSVELLRGGFRFEPVGDRATRVTLTTVYRPLLAARTIWRPFEHRLAHTLHEHVLDGIELRLIDARDP